MIKRKIYLSLDSIMLLGGLYVGAIGAIAKSPFHVFWGVVILGIATWRIFKEWSKLKGGGINGG